jgi:hypothetical protein
MQNKIFILKVSNLTLLTFMLMYTTCFTQVKNLLRNYSLDTLALNVCNTNSPSGAMHWDQNPFNDLLSYNSCINDTFYSIPKNQDGFQFTKHGYGYGVLGLIGTVFGADTRGYSQSKLLRKLKNKRHYIYIYLLDFSSIATSKLQIAITPIKPINPACCQFPIPLPPNFIPQVQNPVGNFITDTANWVKFGSSFKANGNEEYITIGNFNTDANSDTVHVRPLPFPNSGTTGYYVDDMHLVEEDRAVAYFDTTLENGVCVNLGDSIQLGDTLVRPWLFYEWKDAAGNVVGNTRNIMYYGTALGNTFYTLSISDTAADAYITKAIDTVYITTSTNCPTSLKNLMQQSNAVRFSIKNNELNIYDLPPSIKNASLKIRGIDGKVLWGSTLLPSARVPAPLAYRGQGSERYLIDKQLSQGFYFVELLEDDNVIARRKVVVE